MFYRCRCGRSQSWGSMPPARCAWCIDCQSTLASHPDAHGEREPHDYGLEESAAEAAERLGDKPRCRWCYRTPLEVQELEQRRQSHRELAELYDKVGGA